MTGKAYKEFYLPKSRPQIVTVPPMNYIAVRGKDDPNEEGGAYKAAIGVLCAVAYTIKMSKMGDHRIEGYFDFVVPPLEGFWWQDGVEGIDYSDKSTFQWISAIRVPDFVTRADFDWAVAEAARKKKLDCSAAFRNHESQPLSSDEPMHPCGKDRFGLSGFVSCSSNWHLAHQINAVIARKPCDVAIPRPHGTR